MKFFCTCFFLALYLIRPFEFLPALQGIPLLLIVCCLGLLSGIFSLINGQTKWFETETFMLGFMVAIFFSHASHLYLGGALASVEKFLPIFLGYFLVSFSVTTRKQIVFVLYLVAFCACFVAVEGCLEYTRGVSYFGIEPLMENYWFDGQRLTHARIKWLGPFSDPNDLAMLLVIPIPFLLSRFKQSWVVSLGALGVIALLILGIFYTNSRGGMLSLFVAISVYFILRFRNKYGLALGVILGLCLLILGPSRMNDISAGGSSAQGRLEAWYEGFQMFKQNPFFGVGKGMFTDFNELTAHNSFVLVMAELGMFGLFFFTGLFWIPLKKFKRFLWDEGRNSLSVEDIALLSALAASFAAVMTSMFFLSRSYILVPYLLIALTIRLTYLYDSGEGFEHLSAKTLKETAFLAILGIGGVNIFIKVFL